MNRHGKTIAALALAVLCGWGIVAAVLIESPLLGVLAGLGVAVAIIAALAFDERRIRREKLAELGDDLVGEGSRAVRRRRARRAGKIIMAAGSLPHHQDPRDRKGREH